MYRELTLVSVILRILLAFGLGAAIGTERELNKKSAGLKTHTLICIGAAMTTMTSQFLVFNLHMNTDIARLGAQVVAGVGFIGAGIIYISRGRRVKGLTTAAGIWLCAVIGLAVGVGYYEAAICAAVLEVFIEWGIGHIEKKHFRGSMTETIFIEYVDEAALARVKSYFNDLDIKVINTKVAEGSHHREHFEVEYEISLQRKVRLADVISDIGVMDGIISVEESYVI